MTPGIPEDIQLMVNELVRTCMKQKVCVTGFAFRLGSKEEHPFVMQFGDVSQRGKDLSDLFEMLATFVEDANVPRTILRENDA